MEQKLKNAFLENEKLRVTTEQQLAEANIKLSNLENKLINEKRSNFEVSEMLTEMKHKQQCITKENERVVTENEAFRKKISSLETDMEKHIKAGEALMKSMENKKADSNDTAITLFVHDSNKKRRHSEAAQIISS